MKSYKKRINTKLVSEQSDYIKKTKIKTDFKDKIKKLLTKSENLKIE